MDPTDQILSDVDFVTIVCNEEPHADRTGIPQELHSLLISKWTNAVHMSNFLLAVYCSSFLICPVKQKVLK